MKKEIVKHPPRVMTERSPEPEVNKIHQNGKKCKTRRWTAEETKKFYASLGCVHTNFTWMAELFNQSRSRHELKLKFKLEEKRNRDLVDAALGVTHNVDVNSNEKYGSDCTTVTGSDSPADLNPSVKKINKPMSVGNKSPVKDVYVEMPTFKPQAKVVRRVTHNADVNSNGKSDSDLSIDMNHSVKKSSKPVSVGNKSPAKSVHVEVPTFKPRAKTVRRIRRFYFASSSDEEGEQTRNKKRVSPANFKRPKMVAKSSEHPLSKPAKASPLEIKKSAYQCEDQNVLPKSETCALSENFISINRLNIRCPTVLRIGENGKKQTFDARIALRTEDGDAQLKSPKNVLQAKDLPQDTCASNGSLKTRLRPRKKALSSKQANSALSKSGNWPTDISCQKIPQGKLPDNEASLDVVGLLLGPLKDVDVCNTKN